VTKKTPNFPNHRTVFGQRRRRRAFMGGYKAMSANGIYAASVITAVTAQNTRTVSAFMKSLPQLVSAQIDAVLSIWMWRRSRLGMPFLPQSLRRWHRRNRFQRGVRG